MDALSLADCYGHAGVSADAANIAARLEPFDLLSKNLSHEQMIDLTRFYFGLPVSNDTNWFSSPIIDADRSFSMEANKRELAILAMALLAHEISVEGNNLAVLAILVAYACGKRTPLVYPQFVEMVKAAANDLAVANRRPAPSSQIKARTLKKSLGASETVLVTADDNEALDQVLKGLNRDSHEMDNHILGHVNPCLDWVKAELTSLREEKDMLWWLIGSRSDQTGELYSTMSDCRAAYMVGADLAELSHSFLGPRASVFLLKKALYQTREVKDSELKISDFLKEFSNTDIDTLVDNKAICYVRDLCFLNNAIDRANEVGSRTAWGKRYDSDNSLSRRTKLGIDDLVLQSFRESLLLSSFTE